MIEEIAEIEEKISEWKEAFNKAVESKELPENHCDICGVDLEGFVYYNKLDFFICSFCYNDLERFPKTGDEDGL